MCMKMHTSSEQLRHDRIRLNKFRPNVLYVHLKAQRASRGYNENICFYYYYSLLAVVYTLRFGNFLESCYVCKFIPKMHCRVLGPSATVANINANVVPDYFYNSQTFLVIIHD